MDLYTKLSSCMEEMSTSFTARMDQYEEDLKNASANEATHKTIASLSRDFTEFKCLMWKTISALKTQMELLTVGLDRHEMASRRKVLLLHGLSEEGDGDLQAQTVNIIADKMKLTHISSSDILACHRLGVRASKPRPVLIRFLNHSLRSDVWRKKTLLKGSNIVLSEFLTKPRHDVFINARKHFGTPQCWTSEGKIVVLLPDKSRRKLESAAELRQLIAQFPEACGSNRENTTQLVGGTAASASDKRQRKPAK